MEKSKDNRLEQATFLNTLAKDFNRFHDMYLKAWPVLREYKEIPKKMETEGEWHRVVDALSKCYESVRFLNRIALLTESGVIDKDLLYIFYYDEIAEYLTIKLSTLIEWCGTGLDLSADYSSYEIVRTAARLLNLLETLDSVHQEHGADLSVEGYSETIEHFKEKTKDFFTNPGEFWVDSPNYLDRYVTVGQQRK